MRSIQFLGQKHYLQRALLHFHIMHYYFAPRAIRFQWGGIQNLFNLLNHLTADYRLTVSITLTAKYRVYRTSAKMASCLFDFDTMSQKYRSIPSLTLCSTNQIHPSICHTIYTAESCNCNITNFCVTSCPIKFLP